MEDKICPMMNRFTVEIMGLGADVTYKPCYCLGEDCMAWGNVGVNSRIITTIAPNGEHEDAMLREDIMGCKLIEKEVK